MFFCHITVILAAAALEAGASPVDDQSDLSVERSRVKRQESPSVVTPFASITSVTSSVSPSSISLFLVSTTSTNLPVAAEAPPAGPPDDSSSSDDGGPQVGAWPYRGGYRGEAGASCGIEPDLEADDCPLAYDCSSAVLQFPYSLRGVDGRLERSNESCIVVWHPAVLDDPNWFIDFEPLSDAFQAVFDNCATGAWRELISRYAYVTVEGVGTVSVYGRDDPPDYMRDVPDNMSDDTDVDIPEDPPPEEPALTDSLSDNPPEYPFIGRYDGTNLGPSCGEALAPGATNAPKYTDCLDATNKWAEGRFYWGHFKRQSQVSSTCVLVWHPAVMDDEQWSVSGEMIRAWFGHIMDTCRVGDAREFVANYAFINYDLLGTISVYRDGDTPDYMGDAKTD